MSRRPVERRRRACPVPLCNASLRTGYLMCGHCWSRVPRTLQRPVNSSWRALRNAGPEMLAALRELRAAYDDACRAAIDAAEASR